jgi:transposase
MLSLPASVRILLAVEPCDMRKGFDMLAAIVRDAFGEDPLSGHLFVFRSRRGDRLKMLWWDRDGYAIWMKRLEAGTFRMPAFDSTASSSRVELPRRELMMMLEGIDPKIVRKSRRFTCASAERVYVHGRRDARIRDLDSRRPGAPPCGADAHDRRAR